jgi:hypothetical protein
MLVLRTKHHEIEEILQQIKIPEINFQLLVNNNYYTVKFK